MTTEQRQGAGISLTELNLERFAVTATAGRAIAGHSADEQLLKLLVAQGVDMEGVPSPYDDSRADSFANMQALEILGKGERQQLFDSLAWLREKYFAAIGGAPNSLTDHHLLDISLLGMALPDFLMLRAHEPIDPEKIPDVIGNIFITTFGYRDVASTNIANKKIHTYTDPHEPYVFANKYKLFRPTKISLQKYSCPANAALITRASDALLFGNGADPQNSLLPRYLSDEDFGNLFNFSTYHYQNTLNFLKTAKEDMSNTEFHARSKVLQWEVNLALGRNPEGVPDPRQRQFPRDGLVYSARQRIRTALQDFETPDLAQQQRRIVRVQPTGKKRNKRGR